MVEIYGLSWDMVSEIDLARIKKLPRPQLSQVKRLAIDENYLGAKHGFVTTVLDLDTKALVSVTKGRGQAALDQFFSTLKRSKAKIEAVATALSPVRCCNLHNRDSTPSEPPTQRLVPRSPGL